MLGGRRNEPIDLRQTRRGTSTETESLLCRLRLLKEGVRSLPHASTYQYLRYALMPTGESGHQYLDLVDERMVDERTDSGGSD